MKNCLLFSFAGLLLISPTALGQDQCQAAKKAQSAIYFNAENTRSDTFDILKYTIALSIGSTTNTQIGGNTTIRLAPKINNRTFVRLDLLRLIVDSVKEGSQNLVYTYNDTILRINFNSPKNTTDTSLITVYYRGLPQIDASGWGGFYFSNAQSAQYAYNLGVGFAAKPHNYGRVWFPCFDNFVEKSKYEFVITCDSARRSYCSGMLQSDIVTGPNRTRTWVLNEEIPSYLASVAVARYTQVNWDVNTITGNKPIVLVSVPADTTPMKNGFVNLKNCVTGFENYYGPYRWPRVGYCLVPFNGGAMEHATSITYPRFAAGNLSFEDLMAHELSHHWWGNLVTCETPEDMWINEGMASFSAYMFYEWQYGQQTALNMIKAEHDNLLHFLHKKEGFRPISGVPHNLTYGDHVYKKGADVAHTLRGYMGDNAFFAGLQYVMQQKAYQNMNSDEFRDLLQTSSGQNLVSFFADWIYSGGWSHFSIDSVRYYSAGIGSVNAVVSLKQKTYGAPALHSQVPLELSFFQSNWNRVERQVVMSGNVQTFTVNIPFTADYCALNFDSKINDATSHEYRTIKNTGNISLGLAKCNLQIQDKGADSSLVRIIHNYVRPDGFLIPAPHKLSDQHYWKVEGLFSPGFVAKAVFNYNGNKGTSGTHIYMDTLLTIVNADSIALFYRRDAGSEWHWQKQAVKSVINSRAGFFTIDTLKRGEYAFGNLGDTSGVRILKYFKTVSAVKVFPNPAKQRCTVEFSEPLINSANLSILGMDGKEILKHTLVARSTLVDISSLPKGSYTLTISQEKENSAYTQKLIIE